MIAFIIPPTFNRPILIVTVYKTNDDNNPIEILSFITSSPPYHKTHKTEPKAKNVAIPAKIDYESTFETE